VINLGVVAEQAHGGDVGAGLETVRHGANESDATLGGDGVHVRNVGGFERRLARELFQRVVRRSVGDDDRVFHAGGDGTRGGVIFRRWSLPAARLH
jgi:hypothetical protein